MRQSSRDELRIDVRDVDRLTPRNVGREIVMPLLTAAVALLLLAWGAGWFVRLLAVWGIQ